MFECENCLRDDPYLLGFPKAHILDFPTMLFCSVKIPFISFDFLLEPCSANRGWVLRYVPFVSFPCLRVNDARFTTAATMELWALHSKETLMIQSQSHARHEKTSWWCPKMNLVLIFVTFITLCSGASTTQKLTVSFSDSAVTCQSILWLEVSNVKKWLRRGKNVFLDFCDWLGNFFG